MDISPKLIANLLMLSSNLIFTASLVKMVINHITGSCKQKTGPMLGTLLAIILLACGQAVTGLYIAMVGAIFNSVLYLLMVFINEDILGLTFLHNMQTHDSSKNESN